MKQKIKDWLQSKKKLCPYCRQWKWFVKVRTLKVPLKVSRGPITSINPMCRKCINKAKNIKL